MMYSALEFTLVGLIVLFSVYHVSKLLFPRTMNRLRAAVGRRLGGNARRPFLASQSQSTASGCGSCGSGGACGGCAVNRSREELPQLDRTEKPAL